MSIFNVLFAAAAAAAVFSLAFSYLTFFFLLNISHRFYLQLFFVSVVITVQERQNTDFNRRILVSLQIAISLTESTRTLLVQLNEFPLRKNGKSTIIVA